MDKLASLHSFPEWFEGQGREIGLDLHGGGLEIFAGEGESEVVMIDHVGSVGGAEDDADGIFQDELDEFSGPLFEGSNLFSFGFDLEHADGHLGGAEL